LFQGIGFFRNSQFWGAYTCRIPGLSTLAVWQKEFQRRTGKISEMELVQKFNKNLFIFMDREVNRLGMQGLH
jgi:hypothetical protein